MVSKKILIVDNDPVIVRMMHKLLTHHGHMVKTAKDGLAALRVLNHFIPDIAFVDLVMPNIGGDRLCRIIRGLPKLNHLYLVILSGVALENEMDLMAIGANACIAKGPFQELTQPILELVADYPPISEPPPAKAGAPSPLLLKIVDGVYHRRISSELLARRDHSEAILNSLAEGIVDLAADYRIIFVNSAVKEITGIPEERVLGRLFPELFDGTARGEVEGLFKRFEEKPGRYQSTTPIGLNHRKILVHIVGLSGVQTPSRVVILNDVTERVTAQNELQILNERLEQRVIERTSALERAKKKAEEANIAKSRFLMNMGHELRTPLNSIISACDVIGSSSSKSGLARIEKIIRSSSKELLQTFERILDVSRGKDGQLSLQKLPFRLDLLLSQLKKQFTYKGKVIDLDLAVHIEGLDFPNALIGDPVRLAEILFHLAENAAKFSRETPQAGLTVRLVEDRSEKVKLVFELKDNGIGIPSDYQYSIFEAFSQVDTSVTREFDGVGIGLSICKLLVDLMEGEIGVKNNAGPGSTFYFTVWLKRQAVPIPFEHQLFIDRGQSVASDQGSLPENDRLTEIAIDKKTRQNLLPIAEKLARALEAANPMIIEACLKDIRPYRLIQLPQLTTSINEYEYDHALSLVKEIIAALID